MFFNMELYTCNTWSFTQQNRLRRPYWYIIFMNILFLVTTANPLELPRRRPSFRAIEKFELRPSTFLQSFREL